MVCISCIVIPLVLFIWHRFLQPIFLKFWNPWGQVENKTDQNGTTSNSASKDNAASGLSCPFTSGKKEGVTATEEVTDKKND